MTTNGSQVGFLDKEILPGSRGFASIPEPPVIPALLEALYPQ